MSYARVDLLFFGLPFREVIHWDPGKRVGKITLDSRNVEKGDVFVACSGSRMDGHDFLGQAVHAGASVVVFERKPFFSIPHHVTAFHVENARHTFTDLLKRFYHAPDEKVKLVGVTGTNGKTTIAYLLHKLLKEKAKSSYLGTLGYEYGAKQFAAPNTTPGAEVLIPMLHEMVQEDVEFCFMEVSSHSLEQCRVAGLQFEAAAFTQLTQDHLDYHKTMERYFQAKRLLFSSQPLPHHMLINKDCPFGNRLLQEKLSASSFSLTQTADYYASDVQCSLQGSQFVFHYRNKTLPVSLRLPLRHNVANAVTVFGLLDMLGFDPAEFRGMIQEIPGVCGRIERVLGADGFEVFVDYAHTPDAFEQVLSGMRQLKPKRILTLFGCGGDRDAEKRPLMAGIAARYSDVLVMTSDNPRSEDPEAILDDMRLGLLPEIRKKLEIHEILDRTQAIEKLLQLARPGDVLMVLGKGHEDYQILGEEKIPFDDRKVIQACLKRKTRVFFS